MGTDLSPKALVGLIEGDFTSAWDALASTPGNIPRGNFMFALQAMILLELGCRLCFSDQSGALQDFSSQLAARDVRYFTPLPGSCCSSSSQFQLPNQGANPENELIAVLFDLIRNGQAHQYQQIRVRLTDGIDFQVSLTGAGTGLFLSRVFARGRPADHLRFLKDNKGDLGVRVRTDILFLDIRDSIRDANLLGRGLTLQYLERPRSSGSSQYQFSGTDLEAALVNNGH